MGKRDVEAFDSWMETVMTCGIPALESFTQGLQKEYSVIKAALTLPFSNG
jgi:transposase